VLESLGNFARQRRQIDELLYAEIRGTLEQTDPDRTDILSLLLSARDQEGKPMTDQSCAMMSLMFAGSETTATAMSWALYWVHCLPEVRESCLRNWKLLVIPDPMTIFRLSLTVV